MIPGRYPQLVFPSVDRHARTMPHSKLARLLGVEKPRRRHATVEPKRETSLSPSPPLEEESFPVAVTSGTGPALSDVSKCTGWLFLFYDSYAGRTGAGQHLVVRFLPQALLPPESIEWRKAHAVEGRIVVDKALPTRVSSSLGALIDLGEPFSAPRVVSCVVDATGRDASAALQATESDSEAGAPHEGSEEDDDEEEGDDEENPAWDS